LNATQNNNINRAKGERESAQEKKIHTTEIKAKE